MRSDFPITVCVGLLAMLALSSCRQDMHDQPRQETLSATPFFPDGRSARDPVPGAVARGELRADDALYTGRVDGELVTALPMPLSRELIERGRERYAIFCSPCHGGVGDGAGMIVARGFRPPPSFHIERLRLAPVGHYFDAMTNGFGAMASYASRITARDRWAIVSYVRALQLSQRASLDDVPAGAREELESR